MTWDHAALIGFAIFALAMPFCSQRPRRCQFCGRTARWWNLGWSCREGDGSDFCSFVTGDAADPSAPAASPVRGSEGVADGRSQLRSASPSTATPSVTSVSVPSEGMQ